jgi:hypothetical protein
MKILKIDKANKWFKFQFDLSAGEIEYLETWGIPIYDGPCMDGDLPEFDEVIDKIQEQLDAKRLEYDYGVHDISFSKEDLCLWGYTTYEVTADKIESLMNIWHGIWESLGYKVGQPIKM